MRHKKFLALSLFGLLSLAAISSSHTAFAASTVGNPDSSYRAQSGNYWYITIPLHETCVAVDNSTTERDFNFLANGSFGQRANGTHRYRFYGSNNGTIYEQLDNDPTSSFQASYCDGDANNNVLDTSQVLKDITLTLDMGDPSVTISQPTNGSQSTGTNLVFSGTASDDVAVSSVLVDGQPATLNGGSWTFTKYFAAGVYGNVTSTIAVRDTVGHTAYAQVSYVRSKSQVTTSTNSTGTSDTNATQATSTPKSTSPATSNKSEKTSTKLLGTTESAKQTTRLSRVAATSIISGILIVLAGLLYMFRRQLNLKRWLSLLKP